MDALATAHDASVQMIDTSIVRVHQHGDPKTETFQSWAVPSGGIYAGIIRHMRTTRDGNNILIHQSSTNRITQVNIQRRAASR